MEEMEAVAAESEFLKLPAEIHDEIFVHLDDHEIARNRSVCRYWRNVIESIYETYLEMDNHNWENFVKKCTGSKLRVKLKSLQFPIYIAPEFDDFASRLRHLEMTGTVPTYNLVNILKWIPKLMSLALNHLQLDLKDHNGETFVIAPVTEDCDRVEVKHLSIGNTEDWGQLVMIIQIILKLLRKNTMTELNFFHEVSEVLKVIYSSILGKPAEGRLTPYYDALTQMISNQAESLEKVRFNHTNGILPKKPELYLKFHKFAPGGGGSFQIKESCLFRIRTSEHPFTWQHQQRDAKRFCEQILLPIFETQTKMENLKFMVTNQGNFDAIQRIITQNSGTLKEIFIISAEEIQTSYRTISSRIFGACTSLEKLKFHAMFEGRKVKLLDMGQLPTSIRKLVLKRVVPTVSSDWFQPVDQPQVTGILSQFQNLTYIGLKTFPWFIENQEPVLIFEVRHLRSLVLKLPNLKRLKLVRTRMDSNELLVFANSFGMESFQDSISPNLVPWCQGGGDSQVEVKSIAIKHKTNIYGNLFTLIIYSIYLNKLSTSTIA